MTFKKEIPGRIFTFQKIFILIIIITLYFCFKSQENLQQELRKKIIHSQNKHHGQLRLRCFLYLNRRVFDSTFSFSLLSNSTPDTSVQHKSCYSLVFRNNFVNFCRRCSFKLYLLLHFNFLQNIDCVYVLL